MARWSRNLSRRGERLRKRRKRTKTDNVPPIHRCRSRPVFICAETGGVYTESLPLSVRTMPMACPTPWPPHIPMPKRHAALRRSRELTADLTQSWFDFDTGGVNIRDQYSNTLRENIPDSVL